MPVPESGAERLARVFREADRPLFVPYVRGGYPDIAASTRHARILAEHADIIELGIPFSDPLADGPTIQAAGQVALDGGTRPLDVLGIAGELRDGPPVVVMTYYNTVIAQGADVFLQAAADKGEMRAQYVLGIVHWNGDGAVKSLPLAYAYLVRAAAQGLPEATKALNELSQVIPALDRANGWQIATALANGSGIPAQFQPGIQPPPMMAVTTPPPAIPTAEMPVAFRNARRDVGERPEVTRAEPPAAAGRSPGHSSKTARPNASDRHGHRGRRRRACRSAQGNIA
jgi:hypothetical protein